MSESLHLTKNDLARGTRVELIGLLNEVLASAIDLSLQAKQAHWNVKGANFIALHKLFDDLHAEAGEWVDLVAERAVQLGGVADGTLEAVKSASKLASFGLETTTGPEHVEVVSTAIATFGRTVREAIDIAEKKGDADTADLFTEISRGADKMLWFVEAHAQGA